MKLKGSAGVDVDALLSKSQEINRAYRSRDTKLDANPKGETWLIDAPPSKGTPAVSFEMLLIQRVLDDPGSGIEKAKLPNLRKATSAEVSAALHVLQAVWLLDHDLKNVLDAVQFVSALSGKDQVDRGEVDLGARLARTALNKVAWVKKALEAAGPCAAVANFPTAALDALASNLTADAETLERERPKLKLQPLGGAAVSTAAWAAPKHPSPEQLPKAVHLTSRQLETAEDLARAISARLKKPDLAATLVNAINAAGDAGKALQKRLVSFALLLDEAVTAPDYRQFFDGGFDRSVYRARQHAKDHALGRQLDSRAELSRSLTEALASKDPVGAVEAAVVTQFLREIGLKAHEIAGWQARPEAIAAALEAEAFLPLRAFVERGAKDTPYLPRELTHAVVVEAVQSIVEGRYAEWRLTNAGSKEQLAILTEAQFEAFKQRIGTTFELGAANDQKVELKTREIGGESLELFWATKCGGPSHGFDVMVTCALSLVVNGRNTIIVVDDPRWPHPAARTYLRLVSRPETGQPVLFLEGPSLDFPYPRHLMLDLEKACIRHAIEKAKLMGVPLAISGSIAQAVEELKLPVKTHKPYAEPYKLGPSLLLEAASVFGYHDWPQRQAEVRPVVKTHYVLEKPE